MKAIGFLTEKTTFAKINETRALISESIRRILLTVPSERPTDLNFGVGIRRYVFTDFKLIEESLKEAITFQLTKYEPRIILENIVFEQLGQNKWRIRIQYRIRQEASVPQEVDFLV